MANNLLESARTYLSGGIVGQVSNMLGETESNTQTALNGALPAVLSGLIQKAGEPGGPGTILDRLAEVIEPNRAAGQSVVPNGNVLDQLNTMMQGGSANTGLLAMGSGLVANLFGDRAGSIAGALANYSGVKQSSASSLLSLAGPVLLAVMGKQLADEGNTSPSGLTALLSAQGEHLQNAMPSGLGSLLGQIPSFGTFGSAPANTVSTTTTYATTPPVVETTGPVQTTGGAIDGAKIYDDGDNKAADGGNRWLPWLLLLLGVAALIYFLRSCGDTKNGSATTDSLRTDANKTASGVAAAADTVATNVKAGADSVGQAFKESVAKLGAFAKRKLPSGLELNIPERGVENRLIAFIEDKNKPVDKTTWFNFDRLLFDTGKATLRAESRDQVRDIANILKEYPNVNIKIGGYTDNTGSAALNKKLSQERADVVMNALEKEGIAKARLAAEGYGSEHPEATNDTPEGRQQNRRIAVRVTKK